MRRTCYFNLGLVGFLITALAAMSPSPAYCNPFVDDFEGPGLDPFWSTRTDAGAVFFPSTEQVHGGDQAVKLNSTANTGEKYIWLFHDFDEPVYGSASVWMYDTGADELSSNYMGLYLLGEDANSNLQAFDYDLGPTNGGNYYYFNTAVSTSSITSGIDRTKDWHELSISSLPDLLRFEIDGEVVHESVHGTSFDSIVLQMSGPTWRPAYSTYFDDFSFTPIPEPSAFMLAAGCGMVLFLRRRRARRVLP